MVQALAARSDPAYLADLLEEEFASDIWLALAAALLEEQ